MGDGLRVLEWKSALSEHPQVLFRAVLARERDHDQDRQRHRNFFARRQSPHQLAPYSLSSVFIMFSFSVLVTRIYDESAVGDVTSCLPAIAEDRYGTYERPRMPRKRR